MNKLKTAELSGAALALWTGRADGADFGPDCNQGLYIITGGHSGLPMDVYEPHRNWAQGGLLLEKHKINLLDKYYLIGTVHAKDGTWMAYQSGGPVASGQFGPTPLIAICRAVVWLAFGDEVEPVA